MAIQTDLHCASARRATPSKQQRQSCLAAVSKSNDEPLAFAPPAPSLFHFVPEPVSELDTGAINAALKCRDEGGFRLMEYSAVRGPPGRPVDAGACGRAIKPTLPTERHGRGRIRPIRCPPPIQLAQRPGRAGYGFRHDKGAAATLMPLIVRFKDYPIAKRPAPAAFSTSLNYYRGLASLHADCPGQFLGFDVRLPPSSAARFAVDHSITEDHATPAWLSFLIRSGEGVGARNIGRRPRHLWRSATEQGVTSRFVRQTTISRT